MIVFATIGTSPITDKMIEAIRACEDTEVRAAYSRKLETARNFAQKNQIPQYYDSLEDMLSNEEIDAVYVATPNALHYEQVLQALRAGKHVLCEKALASNYRQAQHMMETAKEQGVILMEALRPLYDPDFLEVKYLIHSLGTIRKVQISYCQYSSKYDDFKNGKDMNIFRRDLSAGALMDIGVYCVEMLTDLFGEPEKIQASGTLLRGEIDGEGTILATYPRKTAVLSYSKITGSENISEIQGENGVLYVTALDNPSEIKLVKRNGETTFFPVKPSGSNMKYEVEFFVKSLQDQSAEQQTKIARSQENSLVSMKIMDEARKQMGIVFPADLS